MRSKDNSLGHMNAMLKSASHGVGNRKQYEGGIITLALDALAKVFYKTGAGGAGKYVSIIQAIGKDGLLLSPPGTLPKMAMDPKMIDNINKYL